jgi:hypothetical protein
LGSYRDVPRWKSLYYASRCKGFNYLGHGEWTIYEGVVESVWGELSPEQQAERKRAGLKQRAARQAARLERALLRVRAPHEKPFGWDAHGYRVRMLTQDELERKLKRARYAAHTRRRQAERLAEAREDAAWKLERERILAARAPAQVEPAVAKAA